MSACTMRQLEERHVATKVELMVWCNKMDLLALSNVKGEVALHRLTWQKVWSLPPPSEGTTVKGLAWRPDGKVIAIAYSTSEVLLVDVENKEILHVNIIDGPISSLCWVQEKEIDPATIPNLNIPFQDGQLDFLPKLPSLNRSFDAQSEGLEENFEDSKKVKDQAQLNFLLVGTSDGRVYIKIFGLFPCGVLVDKDASVVLEANISPDMKELYVIVSAKDGEQNVLKLLAFETGVLFSHSKELHALALKYGHIISLLDYLALTMQSITEAWENILLLEMESKLALYAESKPDGSVSADFLELLMFGIASDPLERFLLQELTDKGIKKLGHSIELSHSNIQKLILKHLHSVGQGLAYHLAEMKGMARLTNRFQLLGLEDELVSNALTAAGAFLVKATEVQLVIDDSMKKYKAFFRWLFAVILKATDDRIPDMALTGVNQQDLAFIADYLYSLDGVSSLTLKDGKKQHCYLDRLGQYLVDHELTNPSKSGNNPWEELMKQNPCLANHPSIIPRYEKMSLVQQHKHFVNSFQSLFESSGGAITKLFEVVSTVMISRISKRPQFTWTMGDDGKLLLAFICQEDTMFRFIEVPLEEEPIICNCIDVFFSKVVSTEENGRMKVLDIEFYSPDTLSVLLEQGVENRSAVFIQLPTKSVRQYAAQLGDLIPSIEGNTLLEPGVLKPVDNMVASNFAVSGKRRVAVILSESRRKVRLFEMEVDEEEEDEEAMDGTLTSNQESDTSVLNCSKESIDDEVMKINDIDLD